MSKIAVSVAALLAGISAAWAQDIQGLENCAAEKVMERRTGCLQSNVNYLYQLIGKNAADAQQKLAAANAEVAALKAALAKAQASIDRLEAAAKKPADAAKPK